MIGKIAVKPAARGYGWRPVARFWLAPTWWRLALARHNERTPVDQVVAASEPVAGRHRDGAASSAPPDPRAIVDALYQRHARAVLGYLYHRLPDLADAEDALGDVFVAALQACAGGSTPDLPWLLLVARRRTTDFYRARARGGRPTNSDDADTIATLADPRAQPEEVSLRAEEEHRLRSLIAKLPDEQREVLALRFAAGLRAPRIGVVMGKSEDAVRALLSRAVRRLRQDWGKEESHE